MSATTTESPSPRAPTISTRDELAPMTASPVDHDCQEQDPLQAGSILSSVSSPGPRAEDEATYASHAVAHRRSPKVSDGLSRIREVDAPGVARSDHS